MTEFSFHNSGGIHSGHLEQLAFACPNLQRLDLQGCSSCLSSLQGLRMIAQCCNNLCGLNLKSISVESHTELWEILSSMLLTHLCVSMCAFYIFDGIEYEQNLSELLKRLSCLKALQLQACDDHCVSSACTDRKIKWSLLSNFHALKYCRLFTDDSNAVVDVSAACRDIVCLYCTSRMSFNLVPVKLYTTVVH